jgi:hypothetical protein
VNRGSRIGKGCEEGGEREREAKTRTVVKANGNRWEEAGRKGRCEGKEEGRR